MSIPPTLLVGYDTFTFTCARQAEGDRRGKTEKEAMGAKKKKKRREAGRKRNGGGVLRGRQGRRKGHSEKAGKSASLSTD